MADEVKSFIRVKNEEEQQAAFLSKLDAIKNAIVSGDSGASIFEFYKNSILYNDIRITIIEVPSITFSNGTATLDVNQYVPDGYLLSNFILPFLSNVNDPYTVHVQNSNNNILTLKCYNIPNRVWYSGTTVGIRIAMLFYKVGE